MSLNEIKQELNRLEGQRDRIKTDIDRNKAKIDDAKQKILIVEKAQSIIQDVGKKTQQELEYHISELVSLALLAVFGDDAYSFNLNYSIQRGQSGAVLSFERNGEQYNPIDSSGGGPVDVASFALRVAMWQLQKPKTRPLLVLDEPFRFLSRDLQPKASEMLKMISEKIGLQVVMVSHNLDLIEGADKVFEVRKQNNKSYLVGDEYV